MQGAYRTLKNHNQKGNIPRHIKIETLNIQNKERILKAAKEKRQGHKGKSIRISSFLNTNSKKVMKRYVSGPEMKQLSTQTSLSSKTILPNCRRN
jgi:ribulose bisphosphate carboxylase small subunit